MLKYSSGVDELIPERFGRRFEKKYLAHILVYYKSRENAYGTRMFLALFGHFRIFSKIFFIEVWHQIDAKILV